MAQVALNRDDERTAAARTVLGDLLRMEEPRTLLAGRMSGLDIHYDLGEGHPLLGRRMPDLDIETSQGERRVYSFLHGGRAVLLDLARRGTLDITPWADRVQHVIAAYTDTWVLPVIGPVSAPDAVLIRPDGHVAWVGEGTPAGLTEALATWFGPAAPGGTNRNGQLGTG